MGALLLGVSFGAPIAQAIAPSHDVSGRSEQ
jgi:hypothetical protein